MSNWLGHLLNSFADQAGTWFVGAVLAFLGLFSSRILEQVKFALNRASLRVKFYEEMATTVSRMVFVVDRLDTIYYRADWATEEEKGAIANEYNEVMNALSRKEYVYLSWLHRYWGKGSASAFTTFMDKIRAADSVLINLNAASDAAPKGHRASHSRDAAGQEDGLLAQLRSLSDDLKRAACALLTETF